MSVLLVAISTHGHVQDTLPDLARKHSGIERLIIREFSPVDLSTLVAQSALIGRVLITDATSFLADGGRTISTDYSGLVLSVEKGDPNLLGKSVVVRRPGGRVVVDGVAITGTEPDFPPFERGDEFVLFLKPDTNAYFSVVVGGQGAFKVESGSVRQVSRDFGTWNSERGNLNLTQFLSEIAATVTR
jgi:hypothetical protein